MSLPEDPIWRLRHALLGIALAIVLSVPLAAMAGSALAVLFGDAYGTRVLIYSLLLVHVIVGAAVLFKRVAQLETQAVSVGRVLRWLASLWLWPLLFLATRRKRGD